MDLQPASDPSRPPDRPPGIGWLGAGSFALGVAAFVLWAVVGLPAPLVAVLAVAVGFLAMRRREGGSPNAGPARWGLAGWGLRLGAVHIVAMLLFFLVFGVATLSDLGV